MTKDGNYSEKDKISICEDFIDRRNKNEKYVATGIALDYHIPEDTLYNWLREYTNYFETKKIAKKQVSVPKKETKKVNTEKDTRVNLEKLFLYDDIYTNTHYKKQDQEIRDFYTNTLKVADGINLDEQSAKKELDKLYELITTDSFENRYGRKFTLVDMYLTTNLGVNDLIKNYYGYMNNDQRKVFLRFISRQIKSVDNAKVNNHDTLSKLTISRRFSIPVEKNINKLINLDTVKYNSIDATTEDAADAYSYLTELNSKYGVKYDDISLYIIFREYMEAKKQGLYPRVFDKVAVDYKDELDKLSHVVDRSICSRVLTRRELGSEESYREMIKK